MSVHTDSPIGRFPFFRDIIAAVASEGIGHSHPHHFSTDILPIGSTQPDCALITILPTWLAGHFLPNDAGGPVFERASAPLNRNHSVTRQRKYDTKETGPEAPHGCPSVLY
jgi:hypothetical protein